MERSEISEHQVRVFRFVRDAEGWVTAREIAKGANVSPRTARAHALAFVRAEIFERVDVHPGHRYRVRPRTENRAYLDRLKRAEKVFTGKPRDRRET